MTLRTKLVTSFLACGLIPVGVVAYISYSTADSGMANIQHQGSADLEQKAYNQLVALRDVKKRQIESYFDECEGDMRVLTETVSTLRSEAFNKLIAIRETKKKQIEGFLGESTKNTRFLADNPAVLDGMMSSCTECHDLGDVAVVREVPEEEAKRHHVWLDTYKEASGYEDLYLITHTGQVVYTTAKRSDLGQNVVDGSLKDSPLAKCFEKAMTRPAFEDFAPYAPIDNKPAAFIGAPVEEEGVTIGVLAVQLSSDALSQIVLERSSMGKTGQIYLVGQDQLMRSDSYSDLEHHSVVASFEAPSKGSVNTEASRAACAGETAAKVINDYNGNSVLSAYTPVQFEDLTWGLLVEIDVAEAICPKNAQGEDFFKKYNELYGYYDLFLINPDGYCFYTVCHEADYQTNLVDGKYGSSNLGEVVREVLQTKQFGFADFKSYAPSAGAPAAFLAQPVIHGGETEVVVALQLPEDRINAMMAIRAGLGETGCTYLVARDDDGKISFRSDLTFMDEKYKLGYKVSTPYIEESLATAGAEKHGLFKDSHGNGVLVAYTAVDVFGEHWALLGKIDQVEALAAVKDMNETAAAAGTKLLTWTAGVAVVAALVIAILAFVIARSIYEPLKNTFKGLKGCSTKELRQTGDTLRRIVDGMTDSVAQVNDAAGQVSSASQQLAEGASEQASSLEETSSALEQMAAMTRTNASSSKDANDLATQAHKAANEGETTMTAINESSDQISKIIKVIEEIAFQTNLLALNAAVEAARAGEHGKGFAVVADEVRNLAQRAASAAKEITSLIENSVDKSKEGVTAIKEIVGGVAKVAELLNGIAQASEEQAQGVDQVNSAVSQMDKVTQQNASGAEESASAAEELSAQAEATKSMVDQLVTLVEGDDGRGSLRISASTPGPKKKRANIGLEHLHKAPELARSGVQARREDKRDAQAEANGEFMPLEDGDDVTDF